MGLHLSLTERVKIWNLEAQRIAPARLAWWKRWAIHAVLGMKVWSLSLSLSSSHIWELTDRVPSI
jgi:hypothetical protein